MDKPNFLTKAAEFFGFAPDRVEVMTAEEKTRLESFGEQMAQTEAQIDALTLQVGTATDEIVNYQSAIESLNATVAELETAVSSRDAEIQTQHDAIGVHVARVAELEAQIAALPGAEPTPSASSTDPAISTEQNDPKAVELDITREARALAGKK
jgi:septal ring factor EnvC (AmiA/AmiB activator)